MYIEARKALVWGTTAAAVLSAALVAAGGPHAADAASHEQTNLRTLFGARAVLQAPGLTAVASAAQLTPSP